MVFRRWSRDIKIAVVNLKEHGVLSNREIQAVIDVEPPKSNATRGRPQILLHDDLSYILRLVQFRPDWFLDELLNLLKKNRFISVHYTAIFRMLQRCNVSRKKLKVIARERNEDLRNDYIRQMAQYQAHQIGFLDETSKNDKTPARVYGRSKKENGIVAKKVVEGSMNRELFLEWLEHEVVHFFSSVAIMLSVSRSFECPCHGQCSNSSW
ncbi:hypothetical protein C8J56DRAFT_999645 [Mycena floridula]|nr:hypothetical protein C8J56DRAFT_999645 [Mycena floridula]